jgi:hypothetical protein
MRSALILVAIMATTPASAQFPPPGVYNCVDTLGGTIGTLALLPAGDYEFTLPNDAAWQGQMSSSGTTVRALSGGLATEYRFEGSFETDAQGVTRFAFSSRLGPITCAPFE